MPSIIDARGSFCPGPLMALIAAMKLGVVGEEFEVLSTDRGSAADIPEWTLKAGHETVGNFELDGVYHLVVRKMK
jgi:TusA-related sulfurtransferase